MNTYTLSLTVTRNTYQAANGLSLYLYEAGFNAIVKSPSNGIWQVIITSGSTESNYGDMWTELQAAYRICNAAACEICGEWFTTERPNMGTFMNTHEDCYPGGQES